MADIEKNERRIAPRRAQNWRILFGPTGQLSVGFLADVGPSGASILTEKPLAVGTELEVHFGIEEAGTTGRLQMQAVVRHCTEGRIGVQFINLDGDQREHWWKIMRGAV
jgi:hypothetical protein